VDEITEQIPIPELGAIDLKKEIEGLRRLLVKYGKQLVFADGIIVGKSHIQAYKDAGYVNKTDNAAAVCASKTLRNAKVSRYIALSLEQISRATGISREYLIDCQHDNMLALHKLGEFDKSSKVTAELCKLYNFYPDPKAIIRIEADVDTNEFTADDWELAFALMDAKEEREADEENAAE